MYYAPRMLRALVSLLVFGLSLGCITRAQHESVLAELEVVRKVVASYERGCFEADSDGWDLGLCHDREALLIARLDVVEAHDRGYRQRIDILHQLRAELAEGIRAGELEVQWRDTLPVITVPSKLLFVSGSAELSKQGKAALTKVAVVLARMTKHRFQVAGHTDDAPLDQKLGWADNWELSTEQALTVTRFLISQGVAPGMLSAAGYGEHHPVASNDSADGRETNRRIELILLPDLSNLDASTQ